MSALLPLASSGGWFEGAGILHAVALRMKTLLLIDSDLVVDDGGFLFRMSRGEISEQFFAPPNVPWPRDNPQLVGIGQDDSRAIEMRMDWTPLLAAAGLLQAPGVRMASLRLSPQTRRKLRAEADKLAMHPDIVDTVPGVPAVRELIVRHFLLDAAAAILEGASIAVDVRASAFVKALNEALTKTLGAPVRGSFSFRLHDVRAWQWDGVTRFRQSSSGKKMRDLVGALRRAPHDAAASSSLQAELDRLTGRDPTQPNVVVECIPSYLPHLMEMELLESVPAIYIIGVEPL